MSVCDVIIVTMISRTLRSVADVVIIILNFVGDREHASVASESCRTFSRDQSVHLRVQECGSAEKSGLRDMK